MKLFPASFEKIASGGKDYEIRLNDVKRQKVKIGDTIKFTNTETSQKIRTKVTSLKSYPSFDSLWEGVKDKYSGRSKDDFIESMYSYWSSEEEKQYGGLVIGIKLG